MSAPSRHDTRTTAGKIAVMQAASMGKPLETRLKDSPHLDWTRLGPPSTWDTTWDWLNRDYRIADPDPRYLMVRVDSPQLNAALAALTVLGEVCEVTPEFMTDGLVRRLTAVRIGRPE